MSRLSSSISSSDPAAPQALPPRGAAWRLGAWIGVWLILLDLGASLAFAFPKDPRDLTPSRWALYFDYGRSMEGRLRRGTRPDPDQTAPITLAGWYRPLVSTDHPDKGSDGIKVHFYGMSHSVRLADALQQSSSALSARTVAAPGATANWALGAFRRDQGRRAGDVAVLAIMSSTLPMITTMSALTWNTSFAMPYTADRYRLVDGRLVATPPPFDSFEGYVAAFDDKRRWAEAKRTLAANDTFFDPWLIDETVLDHSSLVRIVRRAWAQKRDRVLRAQSLNESGFDPESEAVRLANAVVADFAQRARREGVTPVIYIVNNYGYGDQLFRALQPALRGHQIAFLNSAAIIDPNVAGSYLPDTHFTDAADRRLSQALERVIMSSRSAWEEPAQAK